MDFVVTPPNSIKQALAADNPFLEQWAEAVRVHLQTLFEKGVFAPVEFGQMPPQPEIVPIMWVFVIKPDKFKARLVLVGSRARYVEELETASPTPRASVWKLMFALAVKLGYTRLAWLTWFQRSLRRCRSVKSSSRCRTT